MTHPTLVLHPTPIGIAVATIAADALVSLTFVPDPEHVPHAELHFAHGERLAPGEAPELTRQLDEYFAGERRRFDIELDWRGASGFTREALETIVEIPYAETASYGEVAALAGRPLAARAVGTACARTPFSLVVPVHRVVRADGSLGEYGGAPAVKRFLLEHEWATLVRHSPADAELPAG